MTHIRLTMAQALVRWLAAQRVDIDGVEQPYFGGVWAIFGHGNVAGVGEALAEAGDSLPTYRAHNEQGMAHAAIAFAKASRRQRAMICTTSTGCRCCFFPATSMRAAVRTRCFNKSRISAMRR
jgi:3D-(3,5/4)-trihydroxycyclohexane-1,2-dione acylhydrolase (decyclizing)